MEPESFVTGVFAPDPTGEVSLQLALPIPPSWIWIQDMVYAPQIPISYHTQTKFLTKS